MKEYVYSPHYDFYINKVRRTTHYNMTSCHLHNKYEIYFLTEGTRRYFINDATYLVHTGNVVLLDKGEIHKTGPVDKEPHTRFVLNFNAEYISSAWGSEAVDRLLSSFRWGVKVLTLPMKMQCYTESILQKMVDLSGDDTQESELLRKSMLTELLIYLRQCATEQRKKSEQPERITNRTVEKVSAYISQNYREPLSLKSIAEQFYISPYYLSHLFKKCTGLSILEYINSVRTRAAKKYLETTKLKITEITELTGFCTSSHFGRIFKQGTGLSPNRYRKYYHKD